MSSYQKVILLGNVGRDPELKYGASGTAVCSISVATSRKWKDKTSGQQKEETEWHRVMAFDKLAEVLGEYVRKGSRLLVEGRLKYGKYTDKDGTEKNTCDIVATEMQLLGGREGEAPAPQRRQAQAPRPAPRPAPASSGFEDMDDDLPPF